jgi:transcriptional regulator with XRE-family HTH domain
MAAKKIEIDLKEAEKLASRGLSLEQIAAAMGISARTLGSRKAESAELAEAIKRGQAQGIGTIANALFENALGGNVTAQIFYLKARAQWKDKHEDNPEDGDEPTPVKVEVMVRDARKP